MKKVLLIDGHSLLFRAHYAFIRNPLVNSKGMNTSAVFGFFNMISPLLEKERPDYVAVAFDVSRRTFRSEIFEGYKAHRKETPEEIRQQTPVAKQVLEAMGIKVTEKENYEADDLLGTLSRRFSAEMGCDVTIVTGDRDALQLVDDRVFVLLTRKGLSDTTLYSPGKIRQEYGLEPVQLIDVKALQGDSSDNIPGVPGVGPKTALKLIRDYRDLDGVYEHIDEIKGKLRQRLLDNRQLAYLSRRLGIIDREVALDFPLEECAPKPAQPQELLDWSAKLEIHAIAKNVSAQDIVVEAGEEPVFEAVTSKERFDSLRNRIEQAELVALDTETTDKNPMKARLVGMSFCFEPGLACYLPLAHSDITSNCCELGREQMLEQLKPLLARPGLKIIGHNLKYDYKVLLRHGFELPGLFFDTLLAAYVLNPTRRRFTLSSLSWELLRHKMKEYKEIVGDREHFGLVPVETATAYAGDDAECTFRLAAILEKQLKEQGMEKLFHGLEMPLLPILAHMEMKGIWIDLDYFKELSLTFEQEIRAAEEEIYEACGERFNLNSPKQLSHVLFEKLGLPVIRKTKTGYSTDARVLDTLENEMGFPVAARINRHRHLSKLKGTYIDPLPNLVGEDGRLHTTFHQFLTSTGRLSSSDPNLQNIPTRTREGRRIRAGFRAHPDDMVFISADYSQIELRILAHLADSRALKDAFAKDRDIHRETASLVFGIQADLVSDEMRNRAKAVNFGVIYGQTGFGLSSSLGLTMKEAKQFIDRYFEKLPEVKAWKERTLEQARRDGSVSTLLGRRRRLPNINKKGRERAAEERIAINTPIQGSAADLIKKAMLELPGRLEEQGLEAHMLVQVHDELLLECRIDIADRVEETVRSVMENALELTVPVTVSIARGKTWDSLKK